MRILTGTAGWADASLIRSGWYPPGTRTAAGRLRYYASQFPLVEVDSAYYALPSAAAVAGWIDAAPDGFTMDVKAYSLLTGHRTRTATLPADLRTRVRGPWLTAQSAPAGLVTELWNRFHRTFEPLRESGLLGLALLQFPPQLPSGLRRRGRGPDRSAAVRTSADGGGVPAQFVAGTGTT